MSEHAKQVKPSAKKSPVQKDYIIIRSYPDTLFFYPSMIVAFLIWVIEILPGDMDPTLQNTLGTFFFAVFAFNFLIIAFDFGVGKTAIIALAVIVLVLVFILIEQSLGITLALNLTMPSIYASPAFYLFFSFLIFIHLILIYLHSRLDYWMISPTEIYHHRGILGDEKRFGNAQHAHIEKTSPDIFEKMLFLSGDLFIKPETDPHIYRISNIFRVNAKEAEIRKILSYVPDQRLDV